MNNNMLDKVYEILRRNDDSSKDLHSFIEGIALGDNDSIDLMAIEFYLKFQNRPDVIKTLKATLSIAEIKKLIFLYNLKPNLDLIDQFNSYFNLTSETENKSKMFFQEISNNFSLEQNILEIGCGWFPSVAKYIDTKQQNTKGTITCYDSKLKILKSGNIVLRRKNIKNNANVSDCDFVYSFNSCTATDTVLQLAQKNHREFILGLCECPKSVPADFIDVMNTKNVNFNNFIEKLSENDRNYIYILSKLNQHQINFCYHNITTEIYSLYLLAKLELLNNEQAEYKLKMQDSLPPIITKKYYKKLY